MSDKNQKKRFFNITRKIILVVLCGLLVIFFILSSYVLSFMNSLMFSEFEKRAQVITNTAALNVENDVIIKDFWKLSIISQAVLEKTEELIQITVYDKSDNLLNREGSTLTSSNYRIYKADIFDHSEYESKRDNLEAHMFNLTDSKTYVGRVVLVFSLDGYFEKVRRMRDRSLLLVFIFLFVMILVLYIVIHLFLGRYLGRLLAAIFRISDGDFECKVDVNTSDEIGFLADAFNKMAKRIQSSHNQLLETKVYNENIVYSMGESLFVINEQGVIDVVNNETTYLLEYLSTEIIGKSFLDFVAFKVTKTHDYEKLVSFISSGEGIVRNLDLFFINKEGKQIPVRFSGSIMHQTDRDKNPKRLVVAVCSDMRETKSLINELKSANEKLSSFSQELENKVALRTQELLASNVYIENILKNFLDTLIVIDKSAKIKEINNIGLTVLGCRENEVISRNVFDFVDGENNWLKRVLDGERVENEEVVFKRKGGAFLPVLLSASLMSAKDHTDNRIVLIAKDISVIKQTEEMLFYAKEKAEKANQAKSFFLANMSHEIRTPINSVLGFADILKETKLDDLQHSYVQAIGESSRILVSLINDILDVSKIESGEMVLEEIDFNLEFLIENVLKMMASRIADNNVELVFYYQHGIAQYLKGDANRLSQVFINLIGNAVKFTKQGQITVSVLENSNDCPDGMASLLVSVKDTGIGIPKNKLNSIFERFVQADESTTRTFGGTGLGLSIVKALIEKMGGSVSVKSDLGSGSEFLFELNLPKTRKEDMGKAIDYLPYHKYAQHLKDKKVVILNSNESIRYVLHAYTSDWGMKVLMAFVEPKEAFEWMLENENEIDAFIIDTAIYNVDFSKELELLKQHDKNIKIIALSLKQDLMKAESAYDGVVDGLISKPLQREDLFKALVANLAGVEVTVSRQVPIVEDVTSDRFEDLNILLAEDNPNNLKLMGVILNQIGCKYDLAENGKIAVDMVRKNDYDIIFMDIQMPLMNGIEATIYIKEKLNKTIPVVALSAAVMTEDKEKAKNAGVDDYLEKPVNIRKFKQHILKWTNSSN